MRNKILFSFIAIAFFTVSSFAQTKYENTKMQVGQQAPELSYPNPDGDTLSLSTISKGKYVLIDFWASWCGPCRHANPAMVALYEKYTKLKFKNAKEGFTILSVSLDKNKEAWVNAIKADKLEWPYHISDLMAWKSAAADLYGVGFIPQAFLIGPDGKIIAKYAATVSKDIAQMATEDLDKFVVQKKKK